MMGSYKKPDLKAKRNREKVKDYLAYPDKDPFGFFARMKEQYPQLAIYSNREIAKWITMYNEAMVELAVTDGWDGIVLPQDLGFVIVTSCKVPEETAARNIDHATSAKVGMPVAYRNAHSSRYVGKIRYYNDIPRHRFLKHKLWTFKPCRKFKRAVSARFKEGRHNEYKQFSKSFRISDIFRKFRCKIRLSIVDVPVRENMEAWKNYNELRIEDDTF